MLEEPLHVAPAPMPVDPPLVELTNAAVCEEVVAAVTEILAGNADLIKNTVEAGTEDTVPESVEQPQGADVNHLPASSADADGGENSDTGLSADARTVPVDVNANGVVASQDAQLEVVPSMKDRDNSIEIMDEPDCYDENDEDGDSESYISEDSDKEAVSRPRFRPKGPSDRRTSGPYDPGREMKKAREEKKKREEEKRKEEERKKKEEEKKKKKEEEKRKKEEEKKKKK